MSDTTLEKIKDQYVEVILHAMPISQLFFVILATVVFDGIFKNNGDTVLNSLENIGLSKVFGMEGGIFWNAPVKSVIGAFFISLINIWFINSILRWSFASSKVGVELRAWYSQSIVAVQSLTSEQKLPIQASLKNELEKRLKKYNTKRMFYEIVFSMLSCMVFGSALFVFLNFSHVKFSVPDGLVIILGILICIGMHRNSINYAISKVISLQVALSAATGELVFFEGIG